MSNHNDNDSGTKSISDLVQVLRDNPDVFQHHPELLELISLPDSRGTASLLEKQVTTLKQRIHQIRSQQSEFIEVVRENEQISDGFASIICRLIGYQNHSEFAAEFPAALRNTFDIDEVSIKTAANVAQRPNDQPAYADTLKRLPNGQALCDHRWPSTILRLFFKQEITSAALIPLRTSGEGEVIGVLALGSTDPGRYRHDLGTAHLNRLGLMTGICLDRLQL